MNRSSSLRGAPGLLVLLLPVLAACGAASRDTILSCTVPADCGPGARCVQGACLASAPPVADFTAPAGLTTHRLVTITATAKDPDAGDSVVGWSWTIVRLTAACDADVDVATAATLEAVFWCAGTYQATLVVSDTSGTESAPVVQVLTVAESQVPPTVMVGADLTVAHRCSGAPLRCAPEEAVIPSATGLSASGGAVTYQWSAIPPDASRGGATVGFTPSATAASPRLTLETGGSPISGAWRLRVRVSDAAGNLAQAVQRVTVGNRAPVVPASTISLPHRYADGLFRVEAPAGLTASDPDGDPLDVSAELVEPGDSGCSSAITAAADGTRALTLACPTPAGLRSPLRLIRVAATDSNGEATRGEVPLEIQNRPPVLRQAAVGAGTELAVDHTVGPCPDGGGPCFLAAGENPFVGEDPDGDPTTVTLHPAVGPGRAFSFGEVIPGAAGDTFRFGTPVSLPSEFRSSTGVSGFSLTATASDPFGASAPSLPALALRILNRPPVAKVPSSSVTVDHWYDQQGGQYRAAAPLATFEDPDGDPLLDTGSVGDASCGTIAISGGAASVACSLPYQPMTGAAPPLAGFVGLHPVRLVAGDGWATATALVNVTIQSRPPTVQPYLGPVEACLCVCPRWEPDLPGVCASDPVWMAHHTIGVFPLHPADLDGDPLATTFTVPSASSASVSPGATTAAPGACTATLTSSSFPVDVQVTVDDGVSQTSATWTATRITCAKAGETCTTPASRR